MNLIKVKFLKNEVPTGRDYAYKSDIVVAVGDTVMIDEKKKGVVTAIDVPESEIEAFRNKVKTIVGKAVKQESTETFDSVKAVKAQNDYCEENKSPHFAHSDGRCWKCNPNIYVKDGKTRRGKVVDGISVERAGN